MLYLYACKCLHLFYMMKKKGEIKKSMMRNEKKIDVNTEQ